MPEEMKLFRDHLICQYRRYSSSGMTGGTSLVTFLAPPELSLPYSFPFTFTFVTSLVKSKGWQNSAQCHLLPILSPGSNVTIQIATLNIGVKNT